MIPDTLRGEYYKGSPTLIDSVLNDAYESPRGPGALPRRSNDNDADVVVAPSYDYDYAAPCAAWSYAELASSGFPDVFIIPVQAQTAATTPETFTTPYGYARVDQTFAKELVTRTPVERDDDVFADDDLVQSQLPLLQHAFSDERERIKILPVALSSSVSLKSFSLDVQEIAVDLERSYKVIVPTNLTEYGTVHGYVPFTQDRVEKLEALDEKTLHHLQNNDPLSFLDHVSEEHLSMPNYLGLVFALLLADSQDIRLHQYYTTHSIDGDDSRIVSFASLSLR